MTHDSFTDPEKARDEWVDVRMTDPEEGEWDVDVVVVEGTVEYVDLRIRPELLTEFIECLADDVGRERVDGLVAALRERTDGDADAASDSE